MGNRGSHLDSYGDLRYFIGVSWPRSGHHVLVRILNDYFGERFGYCEYYEPSDCCKSVPCERAGTITLSKNHDRESDLPISDGGRYLIQYREFCPSVVSDFELYVRNTGKDSAKSFRRFAEKRIEKYLRFMARWATAEGTNADFIRISYEQMTKFPAETIGPVVGMFAPNEPLDRGRLVSSIESAERITVKHGIERPEVELGVYAGRKISAFRYFDEDYFNKLDELTRSSYEEMAAVPAICHVSGWGDSSNARRAQSRPINVERRPIYVDVTGQLALAGVAPTGIPRVHGFIARQAISDPDPNVQVILYDPGAGAYRSLTDGEATLVAAGATAESAPEIPRHWRDSLNQALAIINENANLGKDFDRYHAARISGEKPRKFLYEAVKTFLRGYRLPRTAYSRVWGRFVDKQSKIEPNNDNVLMSYAAAFSSLSARTMLATKRRTFICHDLIPWVHPEFAGDRRQADQFVARLTRLVNSGARALCTSNAVSTMLSKFVDEIGGPKIRIDRFTLPSMLFEMASSHELVPRQPPKQPFVLYCSTIEVRKNHLLLAKVWKRALDEGVPLPKLVCAGKWGWGVEELRIFLKENPSLHGCIEILGPVSDREVVDLYRSALFGVAPSRIEGWGLGALECLDFGVPVIVSTAPALLEATRGLMPAIDPDDEDGWYAGIRHLADSQTAREALVGKIAAEYRPVTSAESWQAIKSLLASE